MVMKRYMFYFLVGLILEPSLLASSKLKNYGESLVENLTDAPSPEFNMLLKMAFVSTNEDKFEIIDAPFPWRDKSQSYFHVCSKNEFHLLTDINKIDLTEATKKANVFFRKVSEICQVDFIALKRKKQWRLLSIQGDRISRFNQKIPKQSFQTFSNFSKFFRIFFGYDGVIVGKTKENFVVGTLQGVSDTAKQGLVFLNSKISKRLTKRQKRKSRMTLLERKNSSGPFVLLAPLVGTQDLPIGAKVVLE